MPIFLPPNLDNFFLLNASFILSFFQYFFPLSLLYFPSHQMGQSASQVGSTTSLNSLADAVSFTSNITLSVMNKNSHISAPFSYVPFRTKEEVVNLLSPLPDGTYTLYRGEDNHVYVAVRHMAIRRAELVLAADGSGVSLAPADKVGSVGLPQPAFGRVIDLLLFYAVPRPNVAFRLALPAFDFSSLQDDILEPGSQPSATGRPPAPSMAAPPMPQTESMPAVHPYNSGYAYDNRLSTVVEGSTHAETMSERGDQSVRASQAESAWDSKRQSSLKSDSVMVMEAPTNFSRGSARGSR